MSVHSVPKFRRFRVVPRSRRGKPANLPRLRLRPGGCRPRQNRRMPGPGLPSSFSRRHRPCRRYRPSAHCTGSTLSLRLRPRRRRTSSIPPRRPNVHGRVCRTFRVPPWYTRSRPREACTYQSRCLAMLRRPSRRSPGTRWRPHPCSLPSGAWCPRSCSPAGPTRCRRTRSSLRPRQGRTSSIRRRCLIYPQTRTILIPPWYTRSRPREARRCSRPAKFRRRVWQSMSYTSWRARLVPDLPRSASRPPRCSPGPRPRL